MSKAKNFYCESSQSYTAEVEEWCERLEALMKEEMYAPIAIVSYMLPGQCTMVGCPLGDLEYQKLGEKMREDPAVFAAAEKTGLLAEGINKFLYAALDNAGSWAGYSDDVHYILENEALRKYVSFSDRYCAECLLACGNIICEVEHEDLWLAMARTIKGKLSNRKTRGYAY